MSRNYRLYRNGNPAEYFSLRVQRQRFFQELSSLSLNGIAVSAPLVVHRLD